MFAFARPESELRPGVPHGDVEEVVRGDIQPVFIRQRAQEGHPLLLRFFCSLPQHYFCQNSLCSHSLSSHAVSDCLC